MQKWGRHSKNKYCDEQNKNRWGLSVNTTRKTDMAMNRIETFGGSYIVLILCYHSEKQMG